MGVIIRGVSSRTLDANLLVKNSQLAHCGKAVMRSLAAA